MGILNTPSLSVVLCLRALSLHILLIDCILRIGSRHVRRVAVLPLENRILSVRVPGVAGLVSMRLVRRE